MHFAEKMLFFNREVRYQIHSESGLAGSGSETIYSGSGSCKKFRIRIHNTEFMTLSASFGSAAGHQVWLFMTSSCPRGSAAWLTRSLAPSTPVILIHDVISSTRKRGRTRCYSEVTSTPYSSYGYSWRHQLHVEARQDTLLQQGHQHPLLQVRLIMTSSCPRGSAAWLARLLAPSTPIMVFMTSSAEIQLHVEARQDALLQRGHQHPLLQVWLFMTSSGSPLEVAWPTSAARTPAPSTPIMVIHDVISSIWKVGRSRRHRS